MVAGRNAQARYAARQKAQDPEGWRERRKAARRRWRIANGEKSYAHLVVYRASRTGKLIRPPACSKCGVECKPEASHDDYTKPLVVEWLCRRCHAIKDLGEVI